MRFFPDLSLVLLAAVLKATLVLAAGALLLRLLGRASAASRHLVALLTLSGALLVPMFQPLVPAWTWRVLPAAPGPHESQTPGGGSARGTKAGEPKIFIERVASERPREEAPPSLGPAGVTLPASPKALGPVSSRSAAAPGAPLTPLGTLALLWAAGAALALVRLGGGVLKVRRLATRARPLASAEWDAARADASRRLGLGRDIPLLASKDTAVPLTGGVFRPFLLLPEEAESWASERRGLVLLHELAHVRRLDTTWLLVAELAAVFYWFHPLARIVADALRREGERAADDLVLRAGTRPSDYAGQLLALVRGLGIRRAFPVAAMARPSQVEERVRAILDPALRRVPPRVSQVAAGAATLVAAAVALAALHVGRAEAAADRTSDGFFAGAGNGVSAGVPVVVPARRLTVLPAPKKESGAEWYRRGMSHHRNERYDDAIAAFKKAIDLGYREDASAYNIACGYALKGDADHAFEWLKKAASYGFDVEAYLDDDDLDGLHSDPRWKDLKREARAAKSQAHKAEGDRLTARLDKLAAAGGKDGPALYRTGIELLNADRYDAAEKAFRASAAAGNRPGASLYNAACAQARAGKKTEALATLRQALEAGYDDPEHMEKDDDLEVLHGEKGFSQVLDLAEDLSLGAGVEGHMGSFLPHTSRSAWRQEIPRYEKVAKAHPEIGRAWFNLGYAQLMGDRPEPAAESLGKALERNYRKSTTLYNLACAEARAGHTDKAFERLFAAIDAGFDSPGKIKGDSDLDSLRGDARFQKALAAARAKSHAEGSDEDDED